MEGRIPSRINFLEAAMKNTQARQVFYCSCTVCSWLNNLLSPLLFPAVESQTGRGRYVKRVRYHGKGMFGMMKITRCHYFVKLVEGPPPPPEPPRTGFDLAKEYVQQLRNRTLVHTLWHASMAVWVSLVGQCNCIKESLKSWFSYSFGAAGAGWCEKNHEVFFLFVKSQVWKNLGATDVTFSELLGPQHSSSTMDCQI